MFKKKKINCSNRFIYFFYLFSSPLFLRSQVFIICLLSFSCVYVYVQMTSNPTQHLTCKMYFIFVGDWTVEKWLFIFQGHSNRSQNRRKWDFRGLFLQTIGILCNECAKLTIYVEYGDWGTSACVNYTRCK